MFRRSLLSLILIVTTSFAVLSHTGHGVLQGHEPGHFLFSAEHAVPLLLVVALAVVLIGRRAWRTQKK